MKASAFSRYAVSLFEETEPSSLSDFFSTTIVAILLEMVALSEVFALVRDLPSVITVILMD